MLLSKVETFQGLEEKACLGEVGHVVLNLISGVMLPKEQTAAEGLQGRSVCVCVCVLGGGLSVESTTLSL